MALTNEKYFKYSPLFVGAAEMSDLDWERLNTKIDRIPQTLADLLVDARTSEFIDAMTQKYIQLSVQGPDVARLIRDVVIADVFIGDMPQEASQRLGIDPATAKEVANLIVSQLFTSVLEELKQAHRARFPNRIPPKIETAPPSVPPVAQSAMPPRPAQTPFRQTNYQGEDLPESGGNIIDLRSK